MSFSLLTRMRNGECFLSLRYYSISSRELLQFWKDEPNNTKTSSTRLMKHKKNKLLHNLYNWFSPLHSRVCYQNALFRATTTTLTLLFVHFLCNLVRALFLFFPTRKPLARKVCKTPMGRTQNLCFYCSLLIDQPQTLLNRVSFPRWASARSLTHSFVLPTSIRIASYPAMPLWRPSHGHRFGKSPLWNKSEEENKWSSHLSGLCVRLCFVHILN